LEAVVTGTITRRRRSQLNSQTYTIADFCCCCCESI